MWNLPDHPEIRRIQRTGYPSWMDVLDDDSDSDLSEEAEEDYGEE